MDYVRKCLASLPSAVSIFSFDAPPPGLDAEANITYADIIPDDYTKIQNSFSSEKRPLQKSEMPLKQSPIVSAHIFIIASVFSIMSIMTKVKQQRIFISA